MKNNVLDANPKAINETNIIGERQNVVELGK